MLEVFMKSKLTILTLLLSLILILTGCQKSSKIQVRIGMWPDSILQEDVLMFNEWKRQFEADYPEYEIIGAPYTYSPDTFVPMAQSGTLPTIFQTWFTEPQKLIQNGFVRDVTDELESLGWLDKMDDEMKKALTFNDNVYGVPRDGYGLGLVINLEIFEMAGLVDDHNSDGVLDILDEEGNPRYPTTFDELAETASIIKTRMDELGENTTGLIVLSANNNGGWQFSNIAWNFGANLQINNNGKWESNLNSPEVVSALEYIKQLKWELDVLPQGTSFSYADWFNYIGNARVAMAFAGSDALSLPVVNYNMDRNKLAYVPMPAGPDGDQYALFGGTPYMFSNRASDKQVIGALKFLEYMGRSPEVSQISSNAMISGMLTAQRKNMPILPSIKPWSDSTYLTQINAIENQYINVKMTNFNDFYDTIFDIRRNEEPNFAQEMYEILDFALQSVLQNQNANPQALLDSADAQFQVILDTIN